MVRMIIALLIATALLFTFGSIADAEEARPLQAGMPNTVTLANGQVVYDLNGEWNVFAVWRGSSFKDNMVRITQEDNNFVGITLTGYGGNISKGSEATKGILEQNGFKEVYWNCSYGGWTAGKGEISEDGNKMIIKYWGERYGRPHIEVVLTFQRK